MTDYAALSKTPHALADGLMLVLQHPANPNVCCTFLSARTLSRTLCHRAISTSPLDFQVDKSAEYLLTASIDPL
jgi:hypothetical protein